MNVLVTGGAGGIGQAIVRAFAQNGHKVIINYNSSKSAAEALAAEIGGIAVGADVSKLSEVEEMFARIRQEVGAVDVLVNNAGVQHQGMLCDMTEEQWRRVLDINLTGAFNTVKCALGDMLYSGGKIINISSIWGQTGASCEVAYSSAKAGLIGFTKALAKEYGNININCICPGAITTSMNSHLSEDELNELLTEIPAGRFGTPEEVAELCLFLGEKGNYITGQIIAVNGGMYI